MSTDPNKEVSEIVQKAMRGELSKREMAMIGLAKDTKKAINRAIETSPALEEAILNIADLCYRDGATGTSMCNGIENTPEPEDTRCTICGDRHVSDRSTHIRNGGLDFTFWPGHEYVITTKIPIERYKREWRMGFLGQHYSSNNMLDFSARGPNRTHGRQFGGTVTIQSRDILTASEVQRDDALRHTDRPVKP